ncbi:NHL repeat domain protein [Thioalkalivibrio nitratireducens DSM 14787]|uniref:NHL repeat domain protein n=2 Tax=Thioalkalivibrio nitratireducens TaxID=186931 RepID=L0DXQ6_THIND|nr:NHL repeat domain protein [Thioalkalivibrio nitratireducens DSM 14787]
MLIMDVNNTPYFLFREEADFDNGSSFYAWNAGCGGALTLAQRQSLQLPGNAPAAARAQWQTAAPLVLDPHGQIGRISPDGQRLEYSVGGEFWPLEDRELAPVQAPAGRFVDLHLGGDGRLVAPYRNDAEQGMVVFHLRRRWQQHLPLPQPVLRAVVDPDSRIWCLSEDRVSLCEGEPLPLPYRAQPERFEPVHQVPQPLRLRWQQPLPDGLTPLAVAADDANVYVLAYTASNLQRILVRPRTPEPERALKPYRVDPAVPFALDLTVAGPGRLALMPPGLFPGLPRRDLGASRQPRDCPVIRLQASGKASLIRERYPMQSKAGLRFVSALDGRLRYQAEADPAFPEFSPRPRELHPLRQPRYATAAAATLRQTLDSGQPGSVWHRIYLEASIPRSGAITIYAKAFDSPDARTATPYLRQIAPLWTPRRSELAFQSCTVTPRPNEAGLFEILLQRPGGNVRRLSGRYLQLRIVMQGDGRQTPSIHAMRVYGPRFCYQEAYLPGHFRQEEAYLPTAGGEPQSANAADLRERFLASLEGMLTPIEATVATAESLVSPEATPADNLPWIAELLGQPIPAGWPEGRRRRLLGHATRLQQYRGTVAGVQLALDIATDGGVQRGEVVVVENFRLRRTMATILGVDMDDRDHPLTLGTGVTGNSIVGDSLILSESGALEFLALFAPELAGLEREQAVQAFFDRYSHQVSVLLHGDGRARRPQVEETLSAQMPAHVRWRVLESDHPFVLGLAPLLAVDTFLEHAPAPGRVTLNDTYLGREGLLNNPTALSPRDVNARTGAPGA